MEITITSGHRHSRRKSGLAFGILLAKATSNERCIDSEEEHRKNHLKGKSQRAPKNSGLEAFHFLGNKLAWMSCGRGGK